MKIEMTRKLEQLYFMFKRKTCNSGINIRHSDDEIQRGKIWFNY